MPKIIRLIIKYSGGLIKDKNQANYFLFGFLVVVIIFTFILLFSGRAVGNPKDIKILPAVL